MQKYTESEFIAAWDRLGSASQVAADLGMSISAVHARRARIAKRGIRLETRPAPGYESRTPSTWIAEDGWSFPRERRVEVPDGCVVVSSDHHYWPGQISLAHRALLEVCQRVRPKRKIVNGDVFDGARVSRHDPHGWSKRPRLVEEMDGCKARLAEIEMAVGPDCAKDWNVGNHDIRFERYLISKAAELEGMFGSRLADHFPKWQLAWSTLINGNVMVKHRHAGGVHAGYNNTMKAGLTIVTGHTHLLEAKPWGDYTGRRWGVQTGSLADLHGPQFEYHENSPSPACSGFAVLTFRDGRLLPPELCECIEGRAYFRGEIVAQ